MFKRDKSCYLSWESSVLKLLEFNNSFCLLYSWIRASSCENLNSTDWWHTCKKFSCFVSISHFTCHEARSTSSDIIIFMTCTMSRACKVSSQSLNLAKIALSLTNEVQIFISWMCWSLKTSVFLREDDDCQNSMSFITQYSQESK